MIAVLADDLTGAAELAGIACGYGLTVALAVDDAAAPPQCDVWVVATDTRSAMQHQAAEHTGLVARQMVGQGCRLFRKTDSALRGHVMAELSAILDATHYSRALFLPANPSRHRIVRHGTYLVDGTPLHETAFSYDPEFPALSSVMKERFPEADTLGVAMPDISCTDDLRRAIAETTPDTLVAGAADAFEAWLQSMGYRPRPAVPSPALSPSYSPSSSPSPSPSPSPLSLDNVLWLCGSTQSTTVPPGFDVAPMPLDFYEGHAAASFAPTALSASSSSSSTLSPSSSWADDACRIYSHAHALALTVPHRHLTGRAVAVRVRTAMASVAASVVECHHPRLLVIEGGATAFCCLSRLGWRHLTVESALAPGVVLLSTDFGVSILLKPGSYPWQGVLQA